MAKKRKAPAAAAAAAAPPPTVTEPEPIPDPEPVTQPEPEPEPEPEQQIVDVPVEEEEEEEEYEEENEQDSEPEPESEPEPVQTQTSPVQEDEKMEEEEEEKLEPVEKLLEPFGKEQLVNLIKEAVDKYPDLIGSVHSLADLDPSHRKIFVHGLGWDTTAETLVSEFSKYGDIEDCKSVVDKISGKSKGYAFILFKHRLGAKKALIEPQKKIGNRVTSCQLASAGPVPAPPPVAPPVSEYTQRKIFVSNVATELDKEKLLGLFSQFGEIEEGPLGLDKVTGRPKGFCLFVYKSLEGAKKALEEPHKVLEGVTLHCYKAVDGPKPGHKGQQHSGFQSNYGGGHGSKRFKSGNNSNSRYPPRGGGGGSHGPSHMMGPSHMGHMNPAAAALAPALGQALTSLLAGQGGGLGNLLGGGFGGQANQGVPPQQGYGGQPGGGYGMQAAYPGQGGGRPMGGGAPYMGHGH